MGSWEEKPVALRDVRKVVQAGYRGINLRRCDSPVRLQCNQLLALNLSIKVLNNCHSRDFDVQARCYKGPREAGRTSTDQTALAGAC